MLKNDFDELQVGDWCFINGEQYIGIRMGEGDRECCILPISRVPANEPTDKPYWRWNGDKEKPSLQPSILHWGNGRNQPATWHGYLTDGKLVTV
jgi:hypothetical protein